MSESSQSCSATGGKADRLLVLYLLNGDLARLILNEEGPNKFVFRSSIFAGKNVGSVSCVQYWAGAQAGTGRGQKSVLLTGSGRAA